MYWITGLLGLAMGITPFVLGYNDNTNALWTSIVLGAIVLLVSAYEGYDRNKGSWEYWIAGLAGIVAIVAPFALGFSALATATWTTLILGALMFLVASYEVFFVMPRQRKA